MYIFINPTSVNRSFIITGKFFNTQTKEMEPIVYYRKETSPGAGQSRLYLLNSNMPVTDTILGLSNKKADINDFYIDPKTDVFTLKA